ncbi:hypothetical protein D9M73_144480 [compost metagenome]
MGLDFLPDGRIGRFVEKVPGDVADALGQAAPQCVIEGRGAFVVALFFDECPQLGGEFGIAGLVVIDPDDMQAIVQQAIAAEVVQGRHEQALDQVAIGAEQKQGTGRC